MTGLNRRVVVTSIDDIAVETEPVPQPRPGEVRVRPTVVGICGSDTHAGLGSHPFIELPYRPGHRGGRKRHHHRPEPAEGGAMAAPATGAVNP